MSRLIDADMLIEKAHDEAKGMPKPFDDFGVLVEWLVDKSPTIEPEPKWKRLMMHLADLQLTYAPNWGANGCGDQKLYEFVTGLIDELQGWEEG